MAHYIIYALLAILSNFGLAFAAGTVVLACSAAFCSIFFYLIHVDHAHALSNWKAVDIPLICPICHRAS